MQLSRKENKKSRFLIILAGICLIFLHVNVSAQDSLAFKTTEYGVRYRLSDTSEGLRPKPGDYIWMNLQKLNHEGKEIFNTQLFEAPEGIEMELKQPKDPGDVEQLFPLMKAGDTLFAEIPYSFFDANEGGDKYYTFQIILYKFLSNETYHAFKKEASERQFAADSDSIRDYLGRWSIVNAVYDSSGLVIWGNLKKGEKIKPGDTVTLQYIGRFLDNSIFESSYETQHPITIVAGRKDVIEGWEIALKYFGLNDRATVLIPSKLGYGDKGAGLTIPPNTVLQFEIEVVDLRPAKEVVAKKKRKKKER
ncbi:MAG: FKBP-type peptidyl-prolyl cis-trans isomerase [Chitinophagales bacterium]|nr:FKBP-type peptidyl-prolyl cis-trans isomerase [Chitinophagales bacterium]